MRAVTQDEISQVLDQYGAFFAFSNEQFEEKRKEGVIYVSLGAGLIAPKGTGQKIVDGIEAARKKGVAQDKKEKTNREIIWGQFANYECQIVGSPEEGFEALEGYGFSQEELDREWKAYWAYCVENDLF